MAIINFPERVYRTTIHAIEAVLGRNKIENTSYSKDITSVAIDKVVSFNRNWSLTNIVLLFSSATSRNVTVAIANGRNVISNYNDFLWFQCGSSNPQKIILTSGFYTGTQLATHLQAMLDANTVFSGLGLTFTVAYSNSAGTFTITPSSGQIKYIQTNNAQVLGQRDSIAGNLFGLTADTALAANVVTDTICPALDSSSSIIALTGNTDLTYNYSTPMSFSVDQAIRITSNTAAVTVTANINYTLNF